MIKLRYPLILASESPRRNQLLTEAGFSFAVTPVKVSENLGKNLNLHEAMLELAKRKVVEALKVYNYLNTDDFLVISADTLVILDGRPLGKPESKFDAELILGLLSGKKHDVKTAVCLYETRTKKYVTGLETTKVYFRALSKAEIQQYIESGEPMDKAGAYGIQGLGGKFVEKYIGPFDNVVGLPIGTLKTLLKENNWLVEEK